MNEERNKEKLAEMLANTWVALKQIGEDEIADKLFKQIEPNLKQKETSVEKQLLCFHQLNQLEMDVEGIWKKIEPQIKFVKKKDWIGEQVCGSFPIVDLRCLIWCCSSKKDCPYRLAVLKKLGKTNEDYEELKRKLVETEISQKFVKEKNA